MKQENHFRRQMKQNLKLLILNVDLRVAVVKRTQAAARIVVKQTQEVRIVVKQTQVAVRIVARRQTQAKRVK